MQSLLSFSRGGNPVAATKQTIYLQHAAKEAINLLTMSASQIEVTFSTEIDDELAITGDYHHLIQIFLNLLSNSRDASPAGGVISIKANRTDHQVELKISDEGSGIDDKVKGHLFEPFVTNKDPGSGTGLGLWVVINLVNSMGGDISIVSPAENSQHGTTATISFPLSSTS